MAAISRLAGPGHFKLLFSFDAPLVQKWKAPVSAPIAVPPLKRKKPGPFARGVVFVLAYLIVVPLNWLMGTLGFRHKLLRAAIHSRKGAESAFRNYSPDEHDIFVCTYPKSGTNWMMQMAHQLIFHGDGAFENIHDVVSWPDMGPKLSGRVSRTLDSTLVQQASPEHKRVIKTHLSTRYVPYNARARYIVVIRDPKEVFVSSYHFVYSVAAPLMPAPAEWFELFLTDGFPMNFGSSWAEHTAGYWALHDKPNVLILSYAGMKQDLAGTVAKVAAFLDVELSPAQRARVEEQCTFAYMKSIDEKFVPMPKGALPWGDMEMMRQGKSGNSGELLSGEQQKRIDAHCQAELARMGSDFPYAAYCQPAAK
jgi:hypothetical protein